MQRAGVGRLAVPPDAEFQHSMDRAAPGDIEGVMGLGALGERLMRISGIEEDENNHGVGGLGAPVEYRDAHSRSSFPKPPTSWWMDHGDPRLVAPNGVIDYQMPGIPWRNVLDGIGEEPMSNGAKCLLGIVAGVAGGLVIGFMAARGNR